MRAHTRKEARSADKRAFSDLSHDECDECLTDAEADKRGCACVQHASLCSCLQLDRVTTHSLVNSWPPRSPSCAHPRLPSFHTTFRVHGWNEEALKLGNVFHNISVHIEDCGRKKTKAAKNRSPKMKREHNFCVFRATTV